MGDQERDQRSELFRREALDHHVAGSKQEGDVLRLSPAWTTHTYWLLLGFALVGLAYLCLGRMNEYAEGPALIRARLKTDVTCPVSAIVSDVLVVPGEQVHEGQLLVQLESDEELAAVQRYEQELQFQLANSLSDPRDDSARRAVASIRSQLAFARQRLESRSLTAPHDGIVSDVRTRPGQPLAPGQLAVTLLGTQNALTLIMVIPGHFRPQLQPGLPARLELAGYAHAYEPVTLSWVSDEIVGPSEARRFLGQDVADAVTMDGPVVFAEATLPRDHFTADGLTYPFVDGLQGTIQIKIRSIPIILNLVPGLRYIYEGRDHGFAG